MPTTRAWRAVLSGRRLLDDHFLLGIPRPCQEPGSPFRTWERVFFCLVLLCIAAGTTILFAYAYEAKAQEVDDLWAIQWVLVPVLSGLLGELLYWLCGIGPIKHLLLARSPSESARRADGSVSRRRYRCLRGLRCGAYGFLAAAAAGCLVACAMYIDLGCAEQCWEERSIPWPDPALPCLNASTEQEALCAEYRRARPGRPFLEPPLCGATGSNTTGGVDGPLSAVGAAVPFMAIGANPCKRDATNLCCQDWPATRALLFKYDGWNYCYCAGDTCTCSGYAVGLGTFFQQWALSLAWDAIVFEWLFAILFGFLLGVPIPRSRLTEAPVISTAAFLTTSLPELEAKDDVRPWDREAGSPYFNLVPSSTPYTPAAF